MLFFVILTTKLFFFLILNLLVLKVLKMSIYKIEDFLEVLKKAGFRMTRQRKAIIEYIAGRPDHPSAQQIYRDLQPAQPWLSLATVYNTLNTLVRMGLIKEIDFEHADNRYDTNLKPHINLVCNVCGHITDYMLELPVSSQSLKDKYGFIIKNYRMEYSGICHSCQLKEAKK